MNKILEIIKRNKDDIIKPVAVLLAICIIIPLALSLTNKITAYRIAELERKNATETMQSLIVADIFEKMKFGADNAFEYHKAVKNGNVVGYIFTTYASGYGGEVSVMTAVNPDGTVKSVSILDASNETPGLGQNVTKENFYTQFEGKKKGVKVLKNGAVSENNEINAVTGATISSTAVTNAVNKALDRFNLISAISSTNESGVVTDEK